MVANSERVLVKDAAREIGITADQVRVYMTRQHLGIINNFDIGIVIPSHSGKRSQYLIFRDKLNHFLGKRNDYICRDELNA